MTTDAHHRSADAERSPLSSLLPLMRAKGVTVTPEAFHRAVNLAFHAEESGVYDDEHRAMWDSLPLQFALLIDDLLASDARVPDRVTVVDVGCGTGLATELLLRTRLASRIARVMLLDTAQEMLDLCQARAAGWTSATEVRLGGIESLPPDPVDLFMTSSVLHHIPDLGAFFGEVRRRQRRGGMFLHVHDPNGEHLKDPELRERQRLWHAWRDARLSSRIRRVLQLPIIAGAVRGLRRLGFGPPDYIARVNARLLEAQVIGSPMTDAEIWSVTDIHVDGLPYSRGEGISLARIGALLPDYELVSARSYGFFGVLASELDGAFRDQESQLVQRRASNGRYLGALWRRVR